MTNEKPPTKDNSNREMAIRTQALDMALRSNCGQIYTANNMPIHDYNKTIEGAKAFENFIRGDNPNKESKTIKPTNELKSQPEPIKKDEWK